MVGDGRKKVRVGTGITAREREPSIFDAEYLDKARSGALVPSNLRFTAPAFSETRERLMALCRRVYAENNFPDPFTSSHPRNLFRPVELREKIEKGSAYFQTLAERGLQLNAMRHCPPEDHSRLWYASRIAILLVKIELQSVKAQEGGLSIQYMGEVFPVPPAGAGLIFASVGWELGQLDAEFRLKFDHEQDALRGKATERGRKKTHVVRRESSLRKNADQFSRISDLLGCGYSVRAAAGIIVAEDSAGQSAEDFGKASDRLAKAFHRHQKRLGQ